jgi:hypothetical protein
VSELKRFLLLHARIAEFLAQQDEATLDALIGGELQFATVRADAAAPDRSRIDLNKLQVNELKALAKQRGFTNYSKLKKTRLIDLLSSQQHDRTETPADEQQLSPRQARPAPVASPVRTMETNAEAAAIALRLRETETEDEGAEYLQAQHLDREGLLAVATELQLTRVERLSQKELRRRVLKQAIGDRRKFAGLRKW